MAYDLCISLYTCQFLHLVSELSPSEHGLVIHCGQCPEPEGPQCIDDGVYCERVLPVLVSMLQPPAHRQLTAAYQRVAGL